MAEALERGWHLTVERLHYVPKGGGAYHWRAEDSARRSWFLTCDDLGTKPWLGNDPESVFGGLQAAYATAVALRRRCGLRFVVAPVPTLAGEVAVRLGASYSLAVFPYLDGTSGVWGQPVPTSEKVEVVGLLAQLHQSAPPAGAIRRRAVAVPGRGRLEAALRDLDRPWNAGPFSESVRGELAKHAEVVTGWLARFDSAAARLAGSDREVLVTHGEPHPGNLMVTDSGLMLLDWDTVALDHPERDLWMISDGTDSAWASYAEATGRAPDATAAALYRLAWQLADLAAFTDQLRTGHRRNADTEKAWTAVREILTSREPSPYGSRLPEEAP